MHTILFLKIYLTIWLLYFPSRSDYSFSRGERDLYANLLKGYEKNLRPMPETNILVQPELNQLIAIDEKTQIMTSSIYLGINWYDPRLKWEINNNVSVIKILLPAKSLWLPDLAVINSAEADGFLRITDQNLVSVDHEGLVFLVVNIGELKTRCKLDLYYFPFDYQKCSILIGSWLHDNKQLRINANVSSFVNEVFTLINPNELWKLVNFTYFGFDYGIKFDLILKRMPLNFVLNNIFPCFVLNSVTFIAYFLNSAQQSTISNFVYYLV